MDSLLPGDEIISTDMAGRVGVDVVSKLSISIPGGKNSFLKIQTSTASLVVTGEHHIPVGKDCCFSVLTAKEVRVGDTVWRVEGGEKRGDIVESIENTFSSGLHSPVLVKGGFPVIDSFVTSFDGKASVWLASFGLSWIEPFL